MSSENEDTKTLLQSREGSSTPDSGQRKARIRYSREFFLSLSGLDICKKLPSGVDKSVLSDLEEALSTVFERQRSVGNLPSQGSRRGEYGSQSLNRSENSNSYTRGSSVRWDARSSGSSDKEGDVQFDRESFNHDSGKRYGNQYRRTWQHQEHDGLLGSGALAKPSGYAGGPTSNARGNGQYQLSKSSEPYQPPRSYKAAPYSRKDGTDSCNDETFGSSECADKDRAEEERKRRESFELMRKEQQKMLLDKHLPDNIKGNLDVDIMALLDNSNTDKNTKSKSKPDESQADSLPFSDFSKSSSFVHVPTVRPLVPPGFASTLMEKNDKLQVNKLKDVNLHSNDQTDNLSASAPSSADITFGDTYFSTSCLHEVNEVWKEGMPGDTFHEVEAGPDKADSFTPDYSNSIFDKLFENAAVKNSESIATVSQNHASDADDEAWSNVTSESLKFSPVFHEESQFEHNEKVLLKDKSSMDLLTLIINNDNLISQGYTYLNDEVTEQNNSVLLSDNNLSLSSTAPSAIAGVSLESYQSDKQSPYGTVLTCADLEQSILAEVKDNCSVMQLKEHWDPVDAKSTELSDVVDDQASHHILSLLQRGTKTESIENSRLDALGSHEMPPDKNCSLSHHISNNATLKLSETDHTTDKCSTLEALFGSAFMSELHSMEAPVSVQKASDGMVTDGGPNLFPFYPSDSMTSTFNDQHSEMNDFEGEIWQRSNTTELSRSHQNAGNWKGFRDSPLCGFEQGDMAIKQASEAIQLPEEDSLISLTDSLDFVTSDSLHFQQGNINESNGPKKTKGDFSDKLHSILRLGDPSRELAVHYPPLMHTSHEMVDPDSQHHHHLQVRPPSQFPHQMNHARPLFASHLDHATVRNFQMNFGSPDVVLRDAHHPYSSNAFTHNSNTNFSEHLDPSARHPMLQAMKYPGNFPSHNTVQVLPHMPMPQPMNHIPMNYVPDLSHEFNHRNAFPLQHRQANFGDLGMGMPGPVGGAGRPPLELYERLLEMEMRANPKFHPAIFEHASGMYGTEFDMNLRYR